MVLLIIFMILFLFVEVEVFCGCYILQAVVVVARITVEVFYGAVAFSLMFVGRYEAQSRMDSWEFHECSEGFEIAYS
jgi:hypothetical protein